MRRPGYAGAALGVLLFALQGCGGSGGAGGVVFGDTAAVQEANELAISCRTEDALALTARTADGTTLAGGLAELQRVVFLRDVGQFAEADAALDARYRRINADARARADTERAVERSLSDLRAERRSRSGRSVCN